MGREYTPGNQQKYAIMNMRIDKDIYTAIRRLAKQERRTIKATVELALSELVKRAGAVTEQETVETP